MQSRVYAGDLWQLGEHRLLCGDCTDPKAVLRLMRVDSGMGAVSDTENQATADMLFLDPPYGVGYGSSKRRGRPQGASHRRRRSGGAGHL